MNHPLAATLPARGLNSGGRLRRGWRLWACTVTASSFGPYVFGGLRTEQIVIYGSALAALPVLHRLRITRLFALAMLCWGGILAVALAGIASSHDRPSGNAFAGVDNLALPSAALLLGAVWSTRNATIRRAMLDVVSATTCICLVANTVLALLTTRSGIPWLSAFWSGTDGVSVAERGLETGRATGVFNQPAEAGLGYSIGLILALWRWSWREQNNGRLAAVSACLTVGGLLSVSKIFVLVGLPVFSFFLWKQHHEIHGEDRVRRRNSRLRRVTMAAPVVALILGMLSTGVFSWGGQERLETLISGDRGERTQADFFSGGRLADDSPLRQGALMVLDEAPWTGYGASGLSRVAYDSALFELLVLTGLAGVALCTLLLVTLALSMSMRKVTLHANERHLAAASLAIVLGASFGIPSMTANRSSGIVWIVLGLALIHVQTSRGGDKALNVRDHGSFVDSVQPSTQPVNDRGIDRHRVPSLGAFEIAQRRSRA